MSCRAVSRVLLVVGAALMLTAPEVFAGAVHTSNPAPVRPQPAPAVVVRPAPVALSITFTAPAPTPTETAYISLRGPDGQLRRFAVEGGADALSTRIVVLHPGESLTIRLPAK